MKKLELRDWAGPFFVVPPWIAKSEANEYETAYRLQQARYYAQFENSQEMAEICRRHAFLFARPPSGSRKH